MHVYALSNGTQPAHSTTMSLSSDGEADVNQTIVVPQNATSVTVLLLSSSVGDILVLNQAGSTVSYEVDNATITIYSLGDTSIFLSYDTDALTTKQGSIWTVQISVSNATVVLPYQSTILYISGVPVSESVIRGSPTLVLGVGDWQVSYGLPIEAATSSELSSSTSSLISTSSSAYTSTVPSSGSSTSRSSTSESSQASGASIPNSTYEVLWAVVVLAAAAAVILMLRRRTRTMSPDQLRPDDLETLRFLKDRGGKVVEAEIRERFSVPRTSAWRQIKRLEQMGYVRVSKLGSQNQIELLKSDFDKPKG
jgi:uncharacterized membrane protein